MFTQTLQEFCRDERWFGAESTDWEVVCRVSVSSTANIFDR